MNIFVSGSLAFDRIMNFPGKFVDVLLPDKLHILNVSFLIDSLVHKRGGTAGNIAYALALLGEKPRILATVGPDCGEYLTLLEGMGLPMDGIKIIPGQQTAGCYLLTDNNNNQINGFHPAAMAFSCEADLSHMNAGDWGIVSPGNVDDMINLPRSFKEKKLPYIFDPGQQIPALTPQAILDGVTGSAMVVANDYELEMICRATQKSREELRALTGHIITTLGAEGLIFDNDPADRIAAVPVREVVDPTGAGDAFRAGLLKGLVQGLELRRAARLGATCAAYCVETSGTQAFTFTPEELAARHRAAFGEDTGISFHPHC